jgi:hypothetical protein
LVWDFLHGFQDPTRVAYADMAYFDAHVPREMDARIQARLSFLQPMLRCDVANQAHVHEWLPDESGRTPAPLTSLQDGLATWREFAACVGVFINADEAVKVIARYGLSDLFELRVRHNPRRASISAFWDRVRTKQLRNRWPRISIRAT